MVDFILVIILIIVLFMVYKQMSCFDELIESIEYPTILIIYDDQYQIAKKYENDTIKCIPKQEIYHFEQSYQDHSNQNALRVFMATLRRKIEKDTNHPHFIVTEVGVGYYFKD